MELKKFTKKPIGQILVEEGCIGREELEQALEIQKSRGGLIGEILVEKGWITEEELLMGLSRQLAVPFIRLTNYNVNQAAAKLVPREVAERYGCFPFDQDEQEVFVAFCDPLSAEALEEVKKAVPLSFQVYLAVPTEIRKAIGLYYGG